MYVADYEEYVSGRGIEILYIDCVRLKHNYAVIKPSLLN